MSMSSAGDEYLMRVSTPAAGDWFAIAFRSWTDPDSEQITQQGLGASCESVLDAELAIEKSATYALVDDNTKDRGEYTVQLNKSENRTSAALQFLMYGNSETANITLDSTCVGNCSVAVSLVTSENLGGLAINETTALRRNFLPFRPYTGNSFHYLICRLLTGEHSTISLSLPRGESKVAAESLVKQIDLTRKSFPDFFLFDYEYLIGNSTKSLPINLTADSLTVLNFEVGTISDVGGTLTVGIKLVGEDKSKDLYIFGCISLGFYIH